jgi:hypothetical protein
MRSGYFLSSVSVMKLAVTAVYAELSKLKATA